MAASWTHVVRHAHHSRSEWRLRFYISGSKNRTFALRRARRWEVRGGRGCCRWFRRAEQRRRRRVVGDGSNNRRETTGKQAILSRRRGGPTLRRGRRDYVRLGRRRGGVWPALAWACLGVPLFLPVAALRSTPLVPVHRARRRLRRVRRGTRGRRGRGSGARAACGRLRRSRRGPRRRRTWRRRRRRRRTRPARPRGTAASRGTGARTTRCRAS
mmetsp:Transcript_23164/g.71211  ORF Transcript_23164/g.71211 Transcript_23164/m.71211 type:complete len:214 (+) Transcript_23164:41-682(+)